MVMTNGIYISREGKSGVYKYVLWQSDSGIDSSCFVWSSLVANALDALNLAKGSAIAIDMPMNVNAVVIYLAIVLAGYVVVSIADSFAAPAISMRLKISEAKAIFTQVFA